MHAEQERINNVYRNWHGGAALERYAWHQPSILHEEAERARAFSALLRRTVGTELSSLRVLDVGCGTGGFLRQLISWGATPGNLTGTELQQDRLDYAARHTADGVGWHLGTLEAMQSDSFDVVTAQTVFSSVLDPALRRALAAEMWRVLRPGGWCLIFDFRYNNPRNPNVRRLTRAELHELWPSRQHHYRSLILAPPVSRALAGMPYLVAPLLTALAPPLRSHFMFMAQKEE